MIHKVSDGRDLLETSIPSRIPVVALKSTVAFPLSISNVRLAIPQNLAFLKAYPKNDTLVASVALLDPDGAVATANFAPIAMACRILSRVHMADGTVQVVLQGIRRVHLLSFAKSDPYFEAEVATTQETGKDSREISQLIHRIMAVFEKLVSLEPRFPEELLKVLRLNISEGSRFADFLPTIVNFTYEDKRKLLQTLDIPQRLEKIYSLLQKEVARALVARDVEKKTEITIEKSQREAYLREQLAVIHRELGEEDPMAAEIAALEEKVRAAKLPKEVEEEALREVYRLRLVGPRASETSVIRTYLDWVLSLPWNKTTKDQIDLKRVRRELDRNHYGMEDVKERIIEFLAVRKLGGSGKGSVLCIVGPPGTGKTSLGASIARAIGRRFVRISIGGIHDEAEIRGHRRTYVAALPGRILQAMRRVGTKNPVMVLDELDKIEKGGHGDPAAALLEVLDPEQNVNFVDHFLEVPFDLSQVLFVATANLDDYISDPLLDRMEIIYLSGYTETEKFLIAKRHIWPKVLLENGLKGRRITISDGAILRSIRGYTQEAGVRELTRTLETICRKIATRVASKKGASVHVRQENLEKFLGPPSYLEERAEKKPEVGVVMGLAWTAAGGDLLLIEALKMSGDGKTTVTGYLGEVMRESVSAAYSYVRSRASSLEIPAEVFQNTDIHIHFPAGAIPKDGPSAGITVATAIASLLSGRPVRHDIAMTGEISLRGKVLPIGGVKEKVLAAYRAGIFRVIMPKENANDLEDIPKEVRQKMHFYLVENVSEVFPLALQFPKNHSEAKKPAAVPMIRPSKAAKKRRR